MYHMPGRTLHAYFIAFNPDSHPLANLCLLLCDLRKALTLSSAFFNLKSNNDNRVPTMELQEFNILNVLTVVFRIK